MTKTIKTPRNLLGSIVSLRLASAENSGAISIIEHRMPFGLAPPLHVHKNEDEIFHIMEGTMRFEIGGMTKLAHAGDVICAPKGVAHSFVVESTGGAHCLTIVRGTDFETMVQQAATPAHPSEEPRLVAPTAKDVENLANACARNGIEIIGPPLAMAA